MEIGVVATPADAALLKEAGFDYIELNIQQAFAPTNPSDEIESALITAKESPLGFPAACVLLPGGMKVVGPEVDAVAVKQCIETVCKRAALVGSEVIVFGSGAGRAVPEGFDRNEARMQLLAFARMAADVAEGYGITIVLEPLQHIETNIFNSLDESGDFVAEVDHPHFRLLVDAFHWAKVGDTPEMIVKHADKLHHAHLATYANRKTPGVEDCDFGPFLKALKQGGYNRRVTVEARFDNLVDEAKAAAPILRKALAEAGF